MVVILFETKSKLIAQGGLKPGIPALRRPRPKAFIVLEATAYGLHS